VCVLIWDDRTSVKMAGLSAGMLHTHDEETHNFFQGTGVSVGKSLRGSSRQKNFLKGITAATNFTHHQKVVCLDVPDADAPMPSIDDKTATPASTEAGRADAAGGSAQPSGRQTGSPSESGVPRRVISFVGGIDLCDGRFDTHDHPLFRTLQLEHKKDFYQDCLAGVDGEAGGPRLPWHDQHCRLEGPPAFDVLTNFVQRWKHESSSSNGAEGLFDLRSAEDLILPADLDNPNDPKVFVVDPKSPEAWRVQVFRSIDSQCCVGFPEDNKAAYDLGLLTDRGLTVDKSIQNAYIHAIRNARNFLYIENQYFLGGSGEWDNKAHADICDNLVPVEIALRCARAVMAGHAFAAYVVIPMWPEGIPEAGSVQEVLLWQTATIRMMYRIVAKAISRKGVDAHPRDYLNIFCLGNREPVDPNVPPPTTEPKAGSLQAKILKTRRFMIYVHAKMLVVDDEYVLEGSANINQRSQDGERDTEIAMGAFQPNFRPQGRGVVYGHRMACFEEHLGKVEDIFESPQDVRCVRRVRELAKENWEAYVSDKVQNLPHGHLLPYPLEVAQNGVVRNLPGFRHFPDTKADVTGKKIQVPAVLRQCLGRTEYVVTT
jgi:phospholipase D1/2